MVEHAKYGSKQNAKELKTKYNWFWEQKGGFLISYFHKFENSFLSKSDEENIKFKKLNS